MVLGSFGTKPQLLVGGNCPRETQILAVPHQLRHAERYQAGTVRNLLFHVSYAVVSQLCILMLVYRKKRPRAAHSVCSGTRYA